MEKAKAVLASENLDGLSYRSEVYRKMIHIGFSLLAACYLLFFDRSAMVWTFGVFTGIIVVGEILRMRFSFFTRVYRRVFGNVVRKSEEHTFTGATFTVFGAFVTVLIFEKSVAVYALLILALGDSLAALVGRRWGRRPLLDKTVEGTVTFLLIAILLALTVPGVPRLGAVLGALVATAVELLPSPVNDNLMIPLSAAITLSMVNLIT